MYYLAILSLPVHLSDCLSVCLSVSSSVLSICHAYIFLLSYDLLLSLSAGPAVSTAASQVFATTLARVWYSFSTSNGDTFLALGTATQAVLFGWRGVFTPVQTLPANGVTGFTAFSPAAGVDVLVVANGGTAGNREVHSQVYMFTAREELTLVSREAGGVA